LLPTHGVVPLSDWVVRYLRSADYLRGVAVEPGIHPDCAQYSVLACPMLVLREFRITDGHTLGSSRRICGQSEYGPFGSETDVRVP
jgi:hypothetical protein